jgi:hypothetical protein
LDVGTVLAAGEASCTEIEDAVLRIDRATVKVILTEFGLPPVRESQGSPDVVVKERASSI